MTLIRLSGSQFSAKEKEKDGFRALWCRHKPADKPDAGIPFDTEDAMFTPPVAPPRRPSSQYSLETPVFAQSVSRDDLTPTPPPPDRPPVRTIFRFLSVAFNVRSQSHRRLQQHRVIPLEEDMRRLFQECKIARGNADVLSQTLAFAKPDALATGLIPVSLSSFHHVRCVTNAVFRNSLQSVALLKS